MISILGGVGLIFFGVRFLRKGLDRLFGGRLVTWLSRATRNRVRALFTGVAVGTVAPSSTGASLMTVQLLSSGNMSPVNLLAVLLGTNIGITVAVQLMALHIQDYAGLMVFGGVIAFQYCRREVLRGIGQCLLALGLIFLAINMIGDGAREFGASPAVQDLMHVAAAYPWLLLITVSILAMLMQSSTASIGFGIAMALGGLLNAETLGGWVIGTNLGIGLTTLIASWGSLDGRRMAIANLLLKVVVAGPFLFIPKLLQTVLQHLPGSLVQEASMLHTGFNVAVAVVALPFLNPIWKLMMAVVPDETQESFGPQDSYLDDKALESPSLALARATRECMRMAEYVGFMLEQFWVAYRARDIQLARRVQAEDEKINAMNLDLKNYLIRIDEGLAPREAQWQFALHGITSDLEAIGDVIDKNLCNLLVKAIREGVRIEGKDAVALREAERRLTHHFQVGISLLTTRDPEEGKRFVEEKERLNAWLHAVQNAHYADLQANNSAIAATSSAVFLDMINAIRRINSQFSTLGAALKGEMEGLPVMPTDEAVAPAALQKREAPTA